jgi:hypothetical protein
MSGGCAGAAGATVSVYSPPLSKEKQSPHNTKMFAASSIRLQMETSATPTASTEYLQIPEAAKVDYSAEMCNLDELKIHSAEIEM